MGKYIKYKLKICKQLCVNITPEHKQHISDLCSEIAIDNYIRHIILEDWGD